MDPESCKGNKLERKKHMNYDIILVQENVIVRLHPAASLETKRKLYKCYMNTSTVHFQ